MWKQTFKKKETSPFYVKSLQKTLKKLSNLGKGLIESTSNRENFKNPYRKPFQKKTLLPNEGITTKVLLDFIQEIFIDSTSNENYS